MGNVVPSTVVGIENHRHRLCCTNAETVDERCDPHRHACFKHGFATGMLCLCQIRMHAGLSHHACAAQVVASYGAMLAYIALALGYLPAGARPWALLVTGRLSLGLGGVLIVARARSRARWAWCSLLGMPASLIMLEVRPAGLSCCVTCCQKLE